MSRLWVLGLAVLPLAACRPKASSDAPSRDVRGWTLAEIEAELAYNDQVLATEGVMVAMASPVTVTAPTTVPGPYPEPAPAPAEEGTDGEPDEAAHTEPAVAPEPAPTAAPSDAYREAETTSFDGTIARRTNRRRMSSRREATTRCERICQLAEATCELQDQICALAESHPDEPRYEQACLRAEQQCVAASRACERCED